MSYHISALRRSFGAFLHISYNRLRGRSFVPHPRTQIFIETSGRCNLACRFCAYPKQETAGGFMTPERFRETVDQSLSMGFRHFGLTPMLGEIFADPTLWEKFAYLEERSDVESYLFYSNFVLPDEATVRALADLEKLSEIHISVYGHDRDSFCKVTRKPGRQYDRLLANLGTLLDMASASPIGHRLHISVRTLGGIDTETLPATELTDMLRALRDGHGAKMMVSQAYDTWGGTITPEDVDPIGIDLTPGTDIYKGGACSLIFGSTQVKADGSVHACACRDVDGSLLLGHLDEAPLAEILSAGNRRYAKLIRDQQRGRFTENCRSCSMYSSVLDDRPQRFAPPYVTYLSLQEAMEVLGGDPETGSRRSA